MSHFFYASSLSFLLLSSQFASASEAFIEMLQRIAAEQMTIRNQRAKEAATDQLPPIKPIAQRVEQAAAAQLPSSFDLQKAYVPYRSELQLVSPIIENPEDIAAHIKARRAAQKEVQAANWEKYLPDMSKTPAGRLNPRREQQRIDAGNFLAMKLLPQ